MYGRSIERNRGTASSSICLEYIYRERESGEHEALG